MKMFVLLSLHNRVLHLPIPNSPPAWYMYMHKCIHLLTEALFSRFLDRILAGIKVLKFNFYVSIQMGYCSFIYSKVLTLPSRAHLSTSLLTIIIHLCSRFVLARKCNYCNCMARACTIKMCKMICFMQEDTNFKGFQAKWSFNLFPTLCYCNTP